MPFCSFHRFSLTARSSFIAWSFVNPVQSYLNPKAIRANNCSVNTLSKLPL